MDYSPSDLARKLAQNPNDSRRLTADDVELFMQTTGDSDHRLALVLPKDRDDVRQLLAALPRSLVRAVDEEGQ